MENFETNHTAKHCAMQQKKNLINQTKKGFQIGAKVQLVRAREVGIVTDHLGDGMLMVLFEEEAMEIPIFESDLILAQNTNQSLFHDFDLPSFPQTSQHHVEKSPKNAVPKAVPTDFGFWVVFEMWKTANGNVEKFDIHLLNGSPVSVAFDMALHFADRLEDEVHDTLQSAAIEPQISHLLWDELNDAPSLVLRLTPLYTEGAGKVVEKTLKIRLQQLLKHPTKFEFWNNQHLFAFKIVDNFTFSTPKSTTKTKQNNNTDLSDLRKYTEQALREQKALRQKAEASNNHWIFQPTPDVGEYAQFPREIDLHIEVLHTNHTTLTNEEIVKQQLRAFDHYIEKAVRLGIPRVFVIHGVGKGRLKEMIAARLRRNNQVQTFRNEYHQKYGWGATEIIFQ